MWPRPDFYRVVLTANTNSKTNMLPFRSQIEKVSNWHAVDPNIPAVPNYFFAIAIRGLFDFPYSPGNNALRDRVERSLVQPNEILHVS